MVCRIVAVERDESTAEALQSFLETWDAKGDPNRWHIRLPPLRSIRLEPPAWPSAEAAEAVAAVEEEMQAESAEAFLKLCEGN